MPNQYGIVEKIARVCQHCGETFYRYPSQATEGRGHYCSRACKGAASRGRATVERTCLACGKQFAIRAAALPFGKGRYCSRPCANAGRVTNRPPCEHCGQPVMHTHTHKRFCSNECRYAHMAAQPKSTVACTCLHCGVLFHVPPGELKQPGRGQYCSRGCKGKAQYTGHLSSRWRGGNVIRMCERCGDSFVTRATLVRSGRGRFCSTTCAGTVKKVDNATRTSWRARQWRLAVITRDNFTCQECGRTDVPRRNLCGHHRLGWDERPDLRFAVDNGVTLCRACHGRLHMSSKISGLS